MALLSASKRNTALSRVPGPDARREYARRNVVLFLQSTPEISFVTSFLGKSKSIVNYHCFNMSIYTKLLSLQKAVVGLTKDKNGNSYQYVSGDKLLGVVRPQMDKLGLLLIQEVVDSSYTRQDYTLYDRNGNPKPKSEMFCALKLKFTWVDTETGEKVECFWASSGQNNWDKGLGSALTYGERYFLLKFFHIATDKDDVDYPRSEQEEDAFGQVIAQLRTLTTLEQMDWAWNTYTAYQNDKTFREEWAKQKMLIQNGTIAQ